VGGGLLAFGRSAAGRLGVGDVLRYSERLAVQVAPGRSQPLRPVAPIALRSASGGGGGKADAGRDLDGEAAFYRCMAAVYFDDGWPNFHAPIDVPFDPGLAAVAPAAGSTASVGRTLILRGVVAGGAHAFLYGSCPAPRSPPAAAARGVADGDDLEFPAQIRGRGRGGWRAWHACKRGCPSVLPDELAGWHDLLCTWEAQPAAVSAPAAAAAVAIDGAASVEVESLAAASGGGVHRLRLGGLAPGPALSTASGDKRAASLSPQLPSLSRPGPTSGPPGANGDGLRHEMTTVKKRTGGGFVYVSKLA
jgi:hypothetical protein